MAYKVEVTDTFGGEANYCWVRRYKIEGSMAIGKAADRLLVREAKKVAGWTGLRCKTSNLGDSLVLRPYKVCQIMFIDYLDGDDSHVEYNEPII